MNPEILVDPEQLGAQLRASVGKVYANKVYGQIPGIPQEPTGALEVMGRRSKDMSEFQKRQHADNLSPYIDFVQYGSPTHPDTKTPTDSERAALDAQQEIVEALQPADLQLTTEIPEVRPALLGLRSWVIDRRIRRNERALRASGDEARSAATVMRIHERGMLGEGHFGVPDNHPILRAPTTRRERLTAARLERRAGRHHVQHTHRGHARIYHGEDHPLTERLGRDIENSERRMARIAESPLRRFNRLQQQRQRLLARQDALDNASDDQLTRLEDRRERAEQRAGGPQRLHAVAPALHGLWGRVVARRAERVENRLDRHQ